MESGAGITTCGKTIGAGGKFRRRAGCPHFSAACPKIDNGFGDAVRAVIDGRLHASGVCRVYRYVLALIFLTLAGLCAARAETRIALVVGNSAYEFAPRLTNPSNDASDMTAKLKGLGFEVFGGTDLDRRSLVEALIRFGRAAETADVAVFFYAGHGLQVNGQNYLVPIDGQVEYEAEVDISLVSLSGVLQQLERGSRTNIVFLDACRNNPFEDKLAHSSNRSAVSMAKGLGRVQTGVGTFIAFATEPDAVAADGSGRNSPFTGALLNRIGEPGQSISDMMISVRNDVLAETGGKQRPWDSSSLTDRFAFAPEAAARKLPEQALSAGREAFEKEAYEQAVEVNSCGAFEAFQRRYPDSFYAELAKERAVKTCAAPQAEQIASAAQSMRAIPEPKQSGVCEAGPFGVDYCASSVLPASKTNFYQPTMMFDGNRATAWVEGDDGDGIGTTITLHFGGERSLVGFEIINGYDKDQRIWASNSRVQEVEASTGDGQVQVITLKDVRGASRFDFDAPVETSWLRLKIKSIYPGSKYKDTAISELYPIFAD